MIKTLYYHNTNNNIDAESMVVEDVSLFWRATIMRTTLTKDETLKIGQSPYYKFLKVNRVK